MTVLLTWEPSPEDVVIFFVITGGWGLADGIWQTQLSTILGDLFGEQLEAIFALGKMLQALGFTVTFAYSGLLPVFAKIYILGTVLFVSLLGYVILELRLRGKSQPCGRRAVLEDGYDITQI
ncbi:protein unc-93 homolog A-like [Saccoglossus kowalevskii]|uniref:UNC93-like protein-like n=1 Tax=Saccoglossus kowalevskii TaxID=10224 RepID=A0ABM0MS04_SACKO|nr:PREDICTED: UNC93-like protein-like [Saccoglossus kowalevskii]